MDLARTTKAVLRAAALARRDAIPADRRQRASEEAAANAAPLLARLRPDIVSGYWPMRSEADPRPLMAEARRLGAAIALPVVTPDGLVFRLWAEDQPLEARAFGLSEPAATAPVVTPDMMIVPLAAFDRTGHRLGYGAGYYDGAIAAIRAGGAPLHALGFGFAAQEEPLLPAEPHDQRLDSIATELDLHRFGD